jgi:hypothetical protein
MSRIGISCPAYSLLTKKLGDGEVPRGVVYYPHIQEPILNRLGRYAARNENFVLVCSTFQL